MRIGQLGEANGRKMEPNAEIVHNIITAEITNQVVKI